MVQTKVVQGKNLKINKDFAEGLIQHRLKMYIAHDRGPSQFAEKAAGRNAKRGGWVSTACKDGVFLRSSLCLFHVNYGAHVLMCLV